MILNNTTTALGDGLLTFQTMIRLLKKFQGEPVYVHWQNKDLGSVFPSEKYGALPLLKMPLDSTHRVITVSWHDYVHGRMQLPANCDFNSAMAIHFDLERTELPREIHIPDDLTVPTYDFVISPYVLNNAEKNMSPQLWQQIVDHLRTAYNASVCVVGKLVMPCDEDLYCIENDIARFKGEDFIKYNFTKYLSNVDYFVNEPLPRVAKLLQNTRKCFISPDTGLAHLMDCIGRPHLRLYNKTFYFDGCLLTSNARTPTGNIRNETTVTFELVKDTIANLIAEE